ncbi:MAG: lysozyme inhibitor LprI family protein [Clostridium sp.]
MKKQSIIKIIAGACVIATSIGFGAVLANGSKKEEKQDKIVESNREDNIEETSDEESGSNKPSENKENSDKGLAKDENKDNEKLNKNDSLKKEESKENEKELVKKEEPKVNKEAITQKSSAIKLNKGEYLEKMNLAESKVNKIYEGEVEVTTPGMMRQARESFDIYDAELNRIYKALRENCSSAKFEEIKNNQIKWLEKRDAEGKKVIDDYAGGREGGIVALSRTAELTKERCYYLINTYMG